MNKFGLNIVQFSLFTVLALVFFVLITGYYAKRTFDFKIPSEKNLLILGNSHPECAINDSIMTRAFNLSRGGSGYFYDYLKAKEYLVQNSNIDTLVLGYSSGDISGKMDSWFTDDYTIKYKIRNHLLLFDFEDYFSLLKGNTKGVLLNTPRTILHNLKVSRQGYKVIRGHNRLVRNKMEEDIQRLNQNPLKNKRKISEYQTQYLSKIYKLCETNNIQLVLLATPIHPDKIRKQKWLIRDYNEFARQKMPKALLVDDSDFKLSGEFYPDLSHLNFRGAESYSKYLKNRGVFQKK